MKILIVAFDFKPRTGGIAEYTHQIARHIHLGGDHVTVFSMAMDGAEAFDSVCEYDVQRGDAQLFSYRKEGGLKRFFQMYREIRDAAQKRGADLIVCNALTGQPHVCWLVARALGIPYCIFTYGLRVREKYPLGRSPRDAWTALGKRFRRNLVLKGADLVFSCSSYTKDLVTNLGVPPSRVVVHHPGVDLRGFVLPTGSVGLLEATTTDLDLTGKPVLLTVGRLVEQKGIDKVIESLSRVVEQVPDLVYVIVGEGPYRDTLEGLVTNSNLWKNVVFAGYVSDQQKSQYYAMADVFVMPSRELADGPVEGFGIVFLEANAFAKPVIGSRSGGVPDAIVHGVTGLLVDPMRTEEIASAIVELLENKSYARQLGVQGRDRVEREFDWTSIVSKMREDWRELL